MFASRGQRREEPSGSGKFGKRTHFRRVEAQHDILMRNTCRDQFGGDTLLSPVLLDPDLAVLEAEIEGGTVYACISSPADPHQQVFAVRIVADHGSVHVGHWLLRI